MIQHQCRCWLLTGAVVLVIDYCHSYFDTKMTCNTQKPDQLKYEPDYGACEVRELFPQKPEDVGKLLSKYVDISNVLIAGCSALGAIVYLDEAKITDMQVIFHDKLHYNAIDISLELVAGAVPVAIIDFCKENPGFNFTFVLVCILIILFYFVTPH